MVANRGAGDGMGLSNQSAAVEYGWEENRWLSLASCAVLQKALNHATI